MNGKVQWTEHSTKRLHFCSCTDLDREKFGVVDYHFLTFWTICFWSSCLASSSSIRGKNWGPCLVISMLAFSVATCKLFQLWPGLSYHISCYITERIFRTCCKWEHVWSERQHNRKDRLDLKGAITMLKINNRTVRSRQFWWFRFMDNYQRNTSNQKESK